MDELLKMGLVREEKSEWNCHSFYVNKHSERVRGKPRLVINYIPLNKVLKNISYLIPKPSDLMEKISKAKIFSKIDMKSGLWQIANHTTTQRRTLQRF